MSCDSKRGPAIDLGRCARRSLQATLTPVNRAQEMDGHGCDGACGRDSEHALLGILTGILTGSRLRVGAARAKSLLMEGYGEGEVPGAAAHVIYVMT